MREAIFLRRPRPSFASSSCIAPQRSSRPILMDRWRPRPAPAPPEAILPIDSAFFSPPLALPSPPRVRFASSSCRFATRSLWTRHRTQRRAAERAASTGEIDPGAVALAESEEEMGQQNSDDRRARGRRVARAASMDCFEGSSSSQTVQQRRHTFSLPSSLSASSPPLFSFVGPRARWFFPQDALTRINCAWSSLRPRQRNAFSGCSHLVSLPPLSLFSPPDCRFFFRHARREPLNFSASSNRSPVPSLPSSPAASFSPPRVAPSLPNRRPPLPPSHDSSTNTYTTRTTSHD
ncbi:hypothetical protein AAT19DRAFT_16184 [Rhodotorula toruloides]|uniref:Uncharacterized protein n=1 Tax=Rhodotorula toruloides TaxID=5286 RepID=A0A2T0A5Y6_RHOTO|nr:hypothetical protein AAT19DRAFT_16184 [Rhodotorula toruloides]